MYLCFLTGQVLFRYEVELSAIAILMRVLYSRKELMDL